MASAPGIAAYDLNGDGTIDVSEFRAAAADSEDLSNLLLQFAREHIGSGKDIDDVLDNHKWGCINGVNQRHKWGLDPNKGTPLQMCAAAAGSQQACRLLIDNGANINYCLRENGRAGAPPLMHAVKTGDISLVKMLLEQGADRSISYDMLGTNEPMDAVQYSRYLALKSGDEALMCLSRLVEYYSMPFGAVSKPTLANSYDVIEADGPLAFAQGHVGAGYDINDMYAGKKWSQLPRFTPLAVVAEAGSLPAVRYLIAAGADVNTLNEHFGGPLHFAVQNHDIQMCKVLLEAGANRDAKTDEPGALSALELAESIAADDEQHKPLKSLIEYYNSVW